MSLRNSLDLAVLFQREIQSLQEPGSHEVHTCSGMESTVQHERSASKPWGLPKQSHDKSHLSSVPSRPLSGEPSTVEVDTAKGF